MAEYTTLDDGGGVATMEPPAKPARKPRTVKVKATVDYPGENPTAKRARLETEAQYTPAPAPVAPLSAPRRPATADECNRLAYLNGRMPVAEGRKLGIPFVTPRGFATDWPVDYVLTADDRRRLAR